MKTEKFNNALEYLDYDLVDEFVKEKEAVQKRKARRKTISILTPLAACLVLFISVSSALFGYNMAFDKGGNQSPENLQVFFEKDGRFVFEYQGRVYQAFVTPMIGSESVDFAEGESVSIKDVGELISTVSVTDKNGNTANMEIYSSKGDSAQGEILLKLDSGYFLAKGID
ncbi:MAG: hypothetical protein J6S23_06590 [Clostridia bacterium]|nr:hypothetical protein [Clostridia bacterium]